MSLKLSSLSPGKLACKNWSRGRLGCLGVDSAEEVDCSEMGGAGRTGGSGWVEARDEELVVTEVESVGSELGKTAGVEFMEGTESKLDTSTERGSVGLGLLEVEWAGLGLSEEWVGLGEVEGRDMGVMDTEEENNSAGGTQVSMAVKGSGFTEEEERVEGMVECMEN